MRPDFAFTTEVLEDGTRVGRRFEDGVLVAETHWTKLPSGLEVRREFDGGGTLVQEFFSVGMLAIALDRRRLPDGRTEEMYFVRKRLVSRLRYETARAEFPDMPAADAALVDTGLELQSAVAAERKARRRAIPATKADPERAAKIDAFCAGMLRGAGTTDALDWIQAPGATLGERSARASRNLISRLQTLGAVRVWACEPESRLAVPPTCDHLVVQLPSGAVRGGILRYIDRLVGEQGHHGEPDVGQQFAYVKLA